MLFRSIEVARTLEHGGVLMAEAPTGVGKSLAYLLPAALHAAETNERVVVATCTRSLQDQLFERDLPALLDALGLALPVALLKGKQNYLCPRALEIIDPDGDDEIACVEALRIWSAGDTVGDLDRFPYADNDVARRMRARVATDPGACTSATCRRARECFWARARRRAAEAKLVIVNHALLARASDAEGILPPFDALIVDEAHRLEGVLSSQLERAVSRHRIDELLRLTGSASGGRRGGSGLLGRVRSFALPLLDSGSPTRERLHGDLDRLSERAELLRSDAEQLFARIAFGGDGAPAASPYSRRVRHQSSEQLLGRDLQALDVVLEHARH